MELRISYDPEADALYIKLKDDKVLKSEEAKEGVIVDLNKQGEIIGIEILNFSKSGIDLNEVIKRGVETVMER
ncbi:MAG: DUF2283 domain-containing protein [Thermoprotei archaeon]|nr:MAG: DUF2283 domain-containing protein [Thermoprotei archaeon]